MSNFSTKGMLYVFWECAVFKHLILGVVFAAIVVETIVAAFLFAKNSALRVKANTYRVQNPQAGFTSPTLGKNERNTPLFPGLLFLDSSVEPVIVGYGE